MKVKVPGKTILVMVWCDDCETGRYIKADSRSTEVEVDACRSCGCRIAFRERNRTNPKPEILERMERARAAAEKLHPQPIMDRMFGC